MMLVLRIRRQRWAWLCRSALDGPSGDGCRSPPKVGASSRSTRRSTREQERIRPPYRFFSPFVEGFRQRGGPKPHGPVQAGRGNGPTVGVPGDRLDGVGVAAQGVEQPAGRDFPDLHRRVGASADEVENSQLRKSWPVVKEENA